LLVEGDSLEFLGKVDLVACHPIDIFSWIKKTDFHPFRGICGKGKGAIGVGPPNRPISNWGWVAFDGLIMFIGILVAIVSCHWQ
jgi:hypothetical protein